MTARHIPLVLITDENFAMQTSVAITSILANKAPGTTYDIRVIAAGCDKEALGPMAGMDGVRILEASLNGYKDIRQLDHIPIAALLKFAICDLVPDHDKLIYLDGDVIVRDDLSSLYELDLEDFYAAALFYLREPDSPRLKINSGVMLFNTAKMRQDGMPDKLMAFRRSLGDKPSMDQQTFNMMLGDRIKPMPVRYNCMAVSFMYDVKYAYTGWDWLQSILQTDYPNVDALIDDACVIHYCTNLKPWAYTHTPQGDEWYKWYLRSPFGNRPLSRKGRLRYYLDVMRQDCRRAGVGAAVQRIIDASWRRLSKTKNTRWG